MTTLIQKNFANSLYEEWLVTNGIGGFACGSLCGTPTRRYHALLNAALPSPYGRMVMLNYVNDELIMGNGNRYPLSQICKEADKASSPLYLTEFKLKNGLPFWKYEIEDVIIEKNLFFIHRQNTLCLSYQILKSSSPIEIQWRPFLHIRRNEQSVNVKIENESYTVHAKNFEYEIECPNLPTLKIYNNSLPPFTLDTKILEHVFYEIEAKRGYESIGPLTSPGFFTLSLNQDERSSFLISTESWENIRTLPASQAWKIENLRRKNLLKTAGASNKTPTFKQLILAADQFIITPITRYQDMIRLQAAGDEIRSVIAGFPWFTDWGRDTMISLEGLTLTTGRYKDAFSILLTFSHYIKDGLIPNMFPEGELKGIYNTADATLWFFHAIDRYSEITKDHDVIEFLLPKLKQIIEAHIKGTDFGIRMDTDGLLIQGEKNLALTWMDAKMGDWVVTPRRGKAVEINALWYNALCLYEKWSGQSLPYTKQCYDSFNQKFWFEKGQYLYDVIEGENGDDSALRPNQIFAISLTFPVLKQERWEQVIRLIEKELLTPVGLRTLSPSDPNYKAFYNGDLQARDSAYHQGTIWPWLLGHYIDAWLKIYPTDFNTVSELLKGLQDHLDTDCIGTIGEIFDAVPPFHARGCFAQAWSVAEFLRCLNKIQPDLNEP